MYTEITPIKNATFRTLRNFPIKYIAYDICYIYIYIYIYIHEFMCLYIYACFMYAGLLIFLCMYE